MFSSTVHCPWGMVVVLLMAAMTVVEVVQVVEVVALVEGVALVKVLGGGQY